MKASRLLTLLLLLQTHQRVTTAELAARLEVSRRTILRDVEALSTAGVPVYAERGRAGGIVLLPGARLNVSHLDPSEMEALSVAGLDGAQREQLGIAASYLGASRKIAARQSAAPPGEVALADLILVENTAWFAPGPEAVNVADLAMGLRARQQLRIRYRGSGQWRAASKIVDPYGLVNKAGRWYLVADHRGDGRLYRLDRLVDYEVLPSPADLRDGETLTSAWGDLKRRVEGTGEVVITARLRATRIDLAQRILGARLHRVSPSIAGWREIAICYEELEAVRQLLQFGDHLEVLSPPTARERVRELAADLAARHG